MAMSAAGALPSRAHLLVALGACVLAGSSPRNAVDAGLDTGTLEGRLELDAPPPRRIAQRYLGTSVRPQPALQPMPAVAWIAGAGRTAGEAAAHAEIAQRDTAFSPAIVVVRAGGSVAFPNQDPFFHNVFSYSSSKRFDLGRYPRGESRTVQFQQPGIVKVYCEVHEFMRSVIVVADDPLHAIVDADGRFTLRDVPAGRHRLTVWHPEKGSRDVMVDIAAGATTRVNIGFE